jgi:MFS family permease
MKTSENEYKLIYTGIFSSLYFTQGVTQSIFTVIIPVFLLNKLGSVDTAALSFMFSIILTPFILKFIYGLLGDKFGSKRLGRRKPWIISSTSFTGIIWIILSLLLPFLLDSNPSGIIGYITFLGFIIMLGVAISDTAMDGFILDICPKDKLGRTTGTVWAFRSVGIIIGGPIILFIIQFIQFELTLIVISILTILFGLLTLKIPHTPITKKVRLGKNLKSMFKRGENWKLFGFSFFMAIVSGVVFTMISLYILVQAGVVAGEGATLDLLEEDISLYGPQAIITLIIGLGVIIGALVGGSIADRKTRRLSVFLSLSLGTIAFLLQLIPTEWFILLVFTFIMGVSSGWNNSSFSAVASEYSKQYPEATSTFYSICTSFANFGIQTGLILTGLVFSTLSSTVTDIRHIFGVVFILMIFLLNLALIPFLLMDRRQYEYKLNKGEQIPSTHKSLKP